MYIINEAWLTFIAFLGNDNSLIRRRGQNPGGMNIILYRLMILSVN